MTTTTTSDGHLAPRDARDPEDPQLLSATQRSRWATQRKSVNSSNNKRSSLLERMGHKKTGSNEKNPPSDGSDPGNGNTQPPQPNPEEQDDGDDEYEEEENENRTLFFNQPLPSQLLDEQGNPSQTFTRNKIRTAKYTPLSFVPKNLWFQFHNVANIFFLFLVILVVS
jgi:phospholipid-translocating ATPase